MIYRLFLLQHIPIIDDIRNNLKEIYLSLYHEKVRKLYPTYIKNECQLVKTLYCYILDVIWCEGNYVTAFTILIDMLIKIIDGKIPYTEFIRYKIVSQHNTFSYPIRSLLELMHNNGHVVNVGDKIEYLVVDEEPILLEDYINSLNTNKLLLIDYKNYIKYRLYLIDKLFIKAYSDYLKIYDYTYQPSIRDKPIYLNTPCKMASHVLENYPLEKFKNTVLKMIKNNTENIENDIQSTSSKLG